VILLDANVLVYAANVDAPQHDLSRAVVDAALSGQLPAALVPQVLLEFFSVTTDPRRMPHPLTSSLAWEQVQSLRAGLPVLMPAAQAMEELDTVVTQSWPIGSRVFDLFLAAQMRSHRIGTICTYNLAHFRGLPGVEALTPAQALERWPLANQEASQSGGLGMQPGVSE
jgi:predicted nucleic acid-binding protein